MIREDIENIPGRSSDIIVGGLLNEVKHQEERIAALENQTAQIDNLIFWKKAFKRGFLLIATLLLSGVGILFRIFWCHPELWTKLVECLK
jgi:hypothetical protein